MFMAFIAPYEELQSLAREMVEQRGYRAKVYLGDMNEGLQAAREAMADGAQVLISRGGTAILIRKTLGVDVIEVRPSVYNAFAYILAHTAPGARIAICGFGPMISTCRPVCDILRRTYETFEIPDADGARATMDRVAAWRPDIVVGDAVSVRLAREKGFDAHLIESSRETLGEAFEQGSVLLNHLQRHIVNERRLSTVLDCAHEGTLLVDAKGIVRKANRIGLDLLGAKEEDAIDQPYRRLLPSEEIAKAVAAGRNQRNVLVTLKGRRFVFDLLRTGLDMEVDSVVIVFQLVEHLQQRENTIRAKLVTRGFYARYNFPDIIHDSAAMREAVGVASDYARTECNIMILGETGTGKELFAQSIHNAGPRANGPFVALNCATLPGNLLESELFGYAPGAFTGALRSGKTGLFEMAHKGTLFLDEVAELDIFFQARLLRVLQAREVMRIGDDKVIPVDVRIVSATNRDPAEEVRAGRMRADLFFRLNVLDLRIPPLRERENDLVLLFRHYLGVYGRKYGEKLRPPPAALYERLKEHSWPGNVRELENFAEKYVTLRGIPPHAVPRKLAAWGGGGKEAEEGEPRTLAEASVAHIQKALRLEKGNVARAAVRLGVDRNTIRRWLAKEAGR